MNDDYALKLAAYSGYENILKHLIKHGANIHSQENYALRWSAYNGHRSVVRCLIKNGASVNSRNHFALRLTCESGHTLIFKDLLKEIKLNNNLFEEVFRLACENNRHNIIKYLLRLDFSLIKLSKCFIKYCSSYNLNLLSDNINKLDLRCDYDFPLILALDLNSIKFIELLIKNGVNNPRLYGEKVKSQ